MPLNKRAVFTAALVLLVLSLCAVLVGNVVILRKLWTSPVRLLEQALDTVAAGYVEPVDSDKLLHGAVRGIVQSLNDPYSHYLNNTEYEQLRQATEGEYYGIGVRVARLDEKHTVVEVFEGSPAADAGLLAADEIVEVDGKDVTQLSLEELVRMIKGPQGTDVHLGIKRKDLEDILSITVTRRKIKLNPVRHFLLAKNVGYVRIIEFSSRTSTQFRDAMADLDSRSIAGLIIDLRQNPGGLLDQAVKIADHFLRSEVIVTVRGRGTSDEVWHASDDGDEPSYPITVLTDAETASAAEVLAAALSENHRATIVGVKTFGKASVQRVFDVSDGAIRLTVARYYTPSGNQVEQNGGVDPDVEVEVQLGEEQQRLIFTGSPDPEKDPALKIALSELKLSPEKTATSEKETAEVGEPAA